MEATTAAKLQRIYHTLSLAFAELDVIVAYQPALDRLDAEELERVRTSMDSTYGAMCALNEALDPDERRKHDEDDAPSRTALAALASAAAGVPVEAVLARRSSGDVTGTVDEGSAR